ncbi:MAG: ATP-binding cassette domain-containing protein [Dehalococcoidales bacterium]|jgi:ABC-2 type transport system ATP-binding protein
MTIIKVENLCKDYRQRKGREGLTGAIKDVFNREDKIVKAVDNVSFSVEKGEIVGYIGPNGAGKSTTIKMLIGILVPSSGAIDVNGVIPFKHRELNARRIGVVFGQRTQLWWDIPLSETLSLMRYVYDVPEQQYQENLKIFADILAIDKFIHTPVRQLSLGQRMRADISVALLHNPDILYLDEPTIGLDVVVKERIREFILEVNKKRNTTVILATHDMSDIERLSSRVMVINTGKLVYDGNLDTLKKRYGSEEMIVAELANKIEDTSELTGMGVDEIKYQDNKITIKYDSLKINSSTVLKWLIDKAETKDISIKVTPIEDVIRKMYAVRN